MTKFYKNIFTGIASLSLGALIVTTNASFWKETMREVFRSELQQDTSTRADLPYKSTQVPEFPDGQIDEPRGVHLKNPSNITEQVTFDPVTEQYIIEHKVGNINYRPSTSMSIDEYNRYQNSRMVRNYWREKSTGQISHDEQPFAPSFQVNNAVFDAVFGSSTINIVPQGSVELIFGVNSSRVDNPLLTERARKNTSFTFDERIQMNVRGTIGERLKVGIEYNTDATFDFENNIKLEYTGGEDDIIKKIEGGNITLPLPGTLITGSQSLFGVKTEMQFGKLTVTGVFSEQKGESQSMQVEGGAQVSDFEVQVHEYEANRHFFLSQYFESNYDRALENFPILNSPITITKVEVWVTNKTQNFESSRNIAAFLDLAESGNNDGKPNIFNPNIIASNTIPYPSNESNNLYSNTKDKVRTYSTISANLQSLFGGSLRLGQDYEQVESARKLTSREFSFHPQLGYISLNTSLNADEILAVAYEYTANGKTFRVGEFSNELAAPATLEVKLLKGASFSPRLPNWRLMMKNIYSLNAFQISSEDFYLNILYQDDETGNAVNYIPGDTKEEILLRTMNLDRLNQSGQKQPDGMFDFSEGLTILANTGKVIFPSTEPFGSYLKKKLAAKTWTPGKDIDINDFIYQELYDSTQTKAELMAEKNKFKIQGSYKSSSGSEIFLNATSVPEGSVKVTAGGQVLTENTDYTVDYTLGRVRIINPGILESGTPINVSLENQSMFNVQTKRMMGSVLNYQVNDNFNVGGVILNLNERPLTSKVNFGNEPVSNTIWGLNTSFKTNSNWITKMVDKLPLLTTKTPSSVLFTAEFAHLIPGSSKAIGKSGTAYIDDFEGSQTSTDLKSFYSWNLASVPYSRTNDYTASGLASGYNRARIAWYVIDPLFDGNESTTPSHIKNDANSRSSHYVRQIKITEIFPNYNVAYNEISRLPVLNLAYYPTERGPYNFDLNVNSAGKLMKPQDRWGGIMRSMSNPDFEAANVEYIEFWLMDPFVEIPEGNTDRHAGKLYINLGNVSEDVLKDSRKSFENGFSEATEPGVWGKVPATQSIVNALDNNSAIRIKQDIGLDGLNNEEEKNFYRDFLASLKNILSDEAFALIEQDPSSDDYHYFRGGDYDSKQLSILERYKRYNGIDGNSPPQDQSPESYPTSGSALANTEDVNGDNTMSETESYYEYEIPLSKEELAVGKGYITDMVTTEVKFANDERSKVNWYQFKVPIQDPNKQVINDISDFKSIRFMRMYLSGFQDSVILRFAKLDLVRGEWRKYGYSLVQGQEDIGTQPIQSAFDVGAVNIEENAEKLPINYVLPPGFDRIIDPTNPQLRELNEQSMSLKVIDLQDGDARAAYKALGMDIRQYKKLRMEVHSEALQDQLLRDGELTVFVRLGTDYKNNYYEYEVPLKVTPLPSGKPFYDNNSESDRLLVWPEENKIEINLDIFQDVKLARNERMHYENSDVTMQTVFGMPHGERNTVYVCGNPNLSNVRTIMVGVRNSNKSNYGVTNDGFPKSGEIWVNELRLTDFNDKGGWAANARGQIKLADFGTVSAAGAISTAGFGSIEQRVNDRSKEENLQYDVSANLEMGKFFPEKWGVSIPVYGSISENYITPQYNPLDPDVELKDALKNAANDEERENIKSWSIDKTTRKSLNFTNVRVQPKEEENAANKPHFYDVGNFSVSYAYNKQTSRNINVANNEQSTHRGGINYIFNNRPTNIQPFRKSKVFNNKLLRLIKDFNFNTGPNSVAFRTDLVRNYHETSYRNINTGMVLEPTVNKDFQWNRMYDVKFDPTRAIKFDFSATNTSVIDEEIQGPYNKNNPNYNEMRNEIWNNLWSLGRTLNYYHQFNVNYTVPINKLPYLDWTSLSARYRGDYGWDAKPEGITENVGNTIKNSNTLQFNGTLNFKTLYNKVAYIKSIDQKYQAKARGTYKGETQKVTINENINVLRAGRKKIITHKLKTEKVTVKVKNSEGQEVPVKVSVLDKSRIQFISETDQRNLSIVIEGEVPKNDNPLVVILENSVRLATMVKDLNITYTRDGGTMMPGYLPSTHLFGSTSLSTPGLPFIMGWQNEDFVEYAHARSWLAAPDTILLSPATTQMQNSLTVRTSIEPISGFKIELTANRTYSQMTSRFYNGDIKNYDPLSDMMTGSFTMSVWTFGSAFEKISAKNNYRSDVFNKFSENRVILSERLVTQRELFDPNYPGRLGPPDLEPGTTNYYGYTETSQQVVIASFISAYMNQDPNTVETDFVGGIHNLTKSLKYLRPTWRVTYDGLSRVPFVQDYLRSVMLSHSYNSSFNVGSFSSNVLFREGLSDPQSVYSAAVDQSGLNYLTQYDVATLSVFEQFSPLFGIDLNWLNSMSNKFEYKRSRNLGLSLANNQLTEIYTKEYVVGVGYRIEGFQLIMNTATGAKDFKSDLNLRADFSIRDDQTVLRKLSNELAEETNQISDGKKMYKLSLSADYQMSDRFNLRVFYDWLINNPYISRNYRTSNKNFGFSMRFTLM